MDPYLERPSLWPDVHHRLITAASDFLITQVRPRYYVRIEERVYVSNEDDPARHVIAPDLRVIETSKARHGTPAISGGSSTGAITAEPVEATTLVEEEVREARLTIIDAEKKDVVTVIEILSPANKVLGSAGRESYLQKRYEVMHSPVHLIEIDLLREGERVVSDSGLPPHDYLAHVSRASRRPKGLLWFIRLEQRLPELPVPLREGDPDAKLDLQSILDSTYDRAAYAEQLEYGREAVPPLTTERAAWADARLREKGMR